MELENYSKQINSLKEIKTFGQLPVEKQKQKRFTIKNNEMILEEIEKSKFVQINDKRYFLVMGLCHCPFLIPIYLTLSNLKETKNENLNHFCRRKNTNLFKWKNTSWKKARALKHKLFTDNKKLYFERFLTMSENSQYNGTFSDNILGLTNGLWKDRFCTMFR